MSLAAYKASIEVYVRVALGDSPQSIAYLPGSIGLSFAKQRLELPQKRIVQIANFLGFALDCAESALDEAKSRLDFLWVVGHPGKLAKVLDNAWDTHSKNSGMAMQAVAQIAREIGIGSALLKQIESALTVEAIIDLTSGQPDGRRLWLTIERRLERLMLVRVPHVRNLAVRLFSMSGCPLGEAA
jgi:cobalt-precorrin-5B (C1)-methyltransferase